MKNSIFLIIFLLIVTILKGQNPLAPARLYHVGGHS